MFFLPFIYSLTLGDNDIKVLFIGLCLTYIHMFTHLEFFAIQLPLPLPKRSCLTNVYRCTYLLVFSIILNLLGGLYFIYNVMLHYMDYRHSAKKNIGKYNL